MDAATAQEIRNKWGMRIDCAELCPGIFPSGTELVGRTDVEVTIMPEASVRISVSAVGAAVISGIALALTVAPFSSGLYVLVPRSVVTISPTDAGTDVLKMYGGTVGVTVDRREFGSVVATVVEADAKKDDMAAAFSAITLTLLSG